MGLFFTRNCGRRRFHDHPSGRRDHNDRARPRNRARRSLGNHGARGRTARNGWRSGRKGNDGRSGARLWHDLSRFRAGRSGSRWLGGNWRGSQRGRGHGRLHRLCRLHRHTNVALLLFLFVLFGQDRFQHIAGFRDVREIDLGDDGLFCMTRGGSSGMRSVTRFLGKMRTYFIRLLRLN